MNRKIMIALATGAALVAGATAAISGEAEERAVKARQALMQVYAFNLGQLGAMVKGEMEYNADLAKASADNLVKATTMNGMAMWPKGSSMDDEGMAGKTWAKADIWADGSDVGEKAKALREAAAQMADVAGNGLDAVKGAMGGVGGACKGCHEKFRAPKN
jgi:cytochrome c556